MTDLPRFTSGSVGPINHAQMNEMMRRLDALKPLIETAAIFAVDYKKKKGDVMLVYARKATDSPGHAPWVDRYAWREIAVKPIDTNNPTEVVAHFNEPDWPNVKDLVVTRGGDTVDDQGQETETYAISVSPFEEGFCICFAMRTLEGSRRYVLAPLCCSSVANESLFQITGVEGEVQVPEAKTGESYTAYLYSAVRMTLVANSIEGISGDGVKLVRSEIVIPFYDFGIHEPNIPVIPEGAEPTPVSLKVGSFFAGTTVQVSSDMEVGYLAQVPRLDIECEER